MSNRVIYSRGFPYGAPLVMLRGGGTKDSGVKLYLKERGFHWDSQLHAWTNYMYREDLTVILTDLRDNYKCEVVPKSDLDPSYVVAL